MYRERENGEEKITREKINDRGKDRWGEKIKITGN